MRAGSFSRSLRAGTAVHANVDVMQFLNNGDFKGGKTFLARIKRICNKKFLHFCPGDGLVLRRESKAHGSQNSPRNSIYKSALQ
jgi:hypothetical protein